MLDFINSLPTRERGEVRNSLRLLREFGTRLGFPDARHLQGKLWELRPGHHRLLYFAQVGHRFVILHAFRKQSGSTPRQDLDLALRRMSELA